MCRIVSEGIPRWLNCKEPSCQCRRCGFNPRVGKIPWIRKWQPTPVFLPGKSHGQRSLAGYSPWGHKRVRHDLAAKQQIDLNKHLLHIIRSGQGVPCVIRRFQGKSYSCLQGACGLARGRETRQDRMQSKTGYDAKEKCTQLRERGGGRGVGW